MPTSEAPTEVNEPKGPAAPDAQTGGSAQETSITGSILGLDTFSARDLEPRQEVSPLEPGEAADGAASHAARGSRWLDYDAHELLEMISELEDERRWARLREGTLWAVLVHIMILLALFLLPRYIKVPSVIDSSRNPKDHQDFTYLDTPFMKPPRPVTPLPQHPLIDKQTMEQMKKLAQPA